MTLGRTSANKIKIKTDSPKGLRAVECGCCGVNCGFKAFQPEPDGSWKTYKYLNFTINGQTSFSLSGCSRYAENGSYALSIETSHTTGCQYECLYAEGTWRRGFDLYGYGYELYFAEYAVSNCVQNTKVYFYGELQDDFYEPFDDFVGMYDFHTFKDSNDRAQVTINDSTDAQIVWNYQVSTGKWSLESCSGDCAGQDYSDDCGCCAQEDTSANLTFTYKLSNERFN